MRGKLGTAGSRSRARRCCSSCPRTPILSRSRLVRKGYFVCAELIAAAPRTRLPPCARGHYDQAGPGGFRGRGSWILRLRSCGVARRCFQEEQAAESLADLRQTCQHRMAETMYCEWEDPVQVKWWPNRRTDGRSWAQRCPRRVWIEEENVTVYDL